MFQLSNKTVQAGSLCFFGTDFAVLLILLAKVIFFDKTEAVLSSKSHTVTYVDKRGQAEFLTIIDLTSAHSFASTKLESEDTGVSC